MKKKVKETLTQHTAVTICPISSTPAFLYAFQFLRHLSNINNRKTQTAYALCSIKCNCTSMKRRNKTTNETDKKNALKTHTHKWKWKWKELINQIICILLVCYILTTKLYIDRWADGTSPTLGAVPLYRSTPNRTLVDLNNKYMLCVCTFDCDRPSLLPLFILALLYFEFKRQLVDFGNNSNK